MAIFQVDSADLMTKSAGVQASIGRLQSEVTGMEAQLRQLQDSWRGQAANNFQEILTQWRLTQVKVEESLASIQQAMTMASNQYSEAEAANAAMFRH